MLGIAAVAILALPSSALGAGWSLQPTPVVPGASNVVLTGVACPTLDVCEAVGSFVNPAGVTVPVAESWDGTSWKAQGVPLPAPITGLGSSAALSSVSCTSPTACTAVGGYIAGPNGSTFAERWDGHSWSVQSTQSSSSTDFAGPELTGVSCRDATACSAVGQANSPGNRFSLAASWNGSSWRSQPVDEGPLSASRDYTNPILRGVSCVSRTACTAVGGNDFGPLVETWNGQRWRIHATPKSPGTLQGVSCRSPRSCAAVGWSAGAAGATTTLTEQWNGSHWKVRRSANVGHASDKLLGVSCKLASACTAVGFSRGKGAHSPSHPLAEAWDGTSWVVQRTPSPASGGVLNSVSCTADRACTAVGASNGAALIERYVAPGVPRALTLRASGVTRSAAVLHGTVNPDGGVVLSCEFQWGTSAGPYTHSTPCKSSPGSGSAAAPVSAPLSRLVPGTTYEYRLQVTNGAGAVRASERRFVTRSSGNRFTLGNGSLGGRSGTFRANWEGVDAFSLYTAGMARSMSIYLHPTATRGSQSLALTIYRDSNGRPGALVARTATLVFKSSSAAGWYGLALRRRVSLRKGAYWIGVLTGGRAGVAGWRYDSAGRQLTRRTSFAGGPTNPFGAGRLNTAVMSIYATLVLP